MEYSMTRSEALSPGGRGLAAVLVFGGSFLPLTALLAVMGLAGCNQLPRSQAATTATSQAPPAAKADQATAAQVVIDNFSYVPSELTVPVGTVVTWVNHDDVPHTVTEVNKQFSSPALDTDERYSHRFTAPGTYEYFCEVHPHMTGKVIVK